MQVTSAAINKNQETWNKSYLNNPRLLYPDAMFLHFLHKYARKNRDIKNSIVIGCGDGVEAFALAKLGIKAHCVDFAENSIKRVQKFAKEDNMEDFIDTTVSDQADLSAFPDDSFDLATSWSVISYGTFQDGMKAISEIYRVLKPGGQFIGILESTDNTAFLNPGVKQIDHKTFHLPEDNPQTPVDVVMTYYDENDVRNALKNFNDLSLSHRVIILPPNLKLKVGQWAFCCIKPNCQ